MAALEKATHRVMRAALSTDERVDLDDEAGNGTDVSAEQAAAAAVVDAAQADAIAAPETLEVGDALALANEAPLGLIGELAQAPAASETAPATTATTPPPAEAGPAPVSPWIIGGAPPPVMATAT